MQLQNSLSRHDSSMQQTFRYLHLKYEKDITSFGRFPLLTSESSDLAFTIEPCKVRLAIRLKHWTLFRPNEI